MDGQSQVVKPAAIEAKGARHWEYVEVAINEAHQGEEAKGLVQVEGVLLREELLDHVPATAAEGLPVVGVDLDLKLLCEIFVEHDANLRQFISTKVRFGFVGVFLIIKWLVDWLANVRFDDLGATWVQSHELGGVVNGGPVDDKFLVLLVALRDRLEHFLVVCELQHVVSKY